MKSGFSVEKMHTGFWKISNHTNLNLILSIKPIKPKRKIINIDIIFPGFFSIIEEEMDLKNLYFSFE